MTTLSDLIMKRLFKNKRFILMLIGLVVLLAGVWGVSINAVMRERQSAVDAAAVQGTRLATLFESHVAGSFRYADDYIKSVRRNYHREGRISAAQEYVADIPPDVKIISGISITDPGGALVFDSRGEKGMKAVPSIKREYLKSSHTNNSDSLVVLAVREGKNTGKYTVLLERRVFDLEGKFQGVISASLEEFTLMRFLNSTQLGPNSSVMLVDLDKRLRIYKSENGIVGGADTVESPVFWENLQEKPAGMFQLESVDGGVPGMFMYRKLAGFPVVAVIGIAIPDIFETTSGFEKTAYILATLISLIVTGISILALREVDAAELNRELAERARSEKQLRAEENLLRMILESSPVGVSLISLSTNKRFYGNPRLIEMFGGATEEELLAFPTDDKFAESTEVLRRRIDGTTWWCVVNRQKISYNGEDCLIVWYYDITDRKVAEDRFRSFANSAADWYWEMDQDLRFTFFSERFFDVTGILPEMLLGKTREEAGIPNVDPVAWKRQLADLAARRPFRNFVHPRTKPGGGVSWVSINGRPVFDDDGVFRGYRGTGSDVTAVKLAEEKLYKALEQAETANRVKSEFLATMSHELRTPLNAIIGFSEIIIGQFFGKLGSEKYEEYATDIHNSGTHLLNLVNDILDLSAIEAGKHTLSEEEVSIHDVIDDCSPIIVEASRRKDVEYKVEMPDSLPLLFADRRSLRQILLNVLSNAVKFTPEKGSITLYVSVSKGAIAFKVSDNGRGIPSEDLHNLIDPFVRTDSDPHKPQEGTGLGLAIVSSLVGLHEGDLSIESELGTGTTVTVKFPEERTVQPSGRSLFRIL